ncbi:histidinol-phosphate transaminase [Treponema zuelzerae]|uniref:Histidinol-phosphate aminotransferase n=1 Tax=Teretinema zuelzerae TaxID=156 RepID=A0AAE3EJ63_9SPIR|nr:histidinol-phosphate transaminase [Teretinema zuelzerae]MCD1655667.1 histidinol-phosphate transaminase [Teretinema zuelzerae]
MFAKRFAGLKPYVPGEQPTDRAYIKLNANENPYPPSPEVEKVLRDFDPALFQRYPDPDARELRSAIADMLGGGVSPEMIFAGNGSDEVLSFVFYAFFDSDSPLRFPEHTYSFYPVYAGYYDIPVIKTPLLSDFSIDTEALSEGPGTGVIFANPNAPTGIYLPLDKIRNLLDSVPRDRVVVVDEAYIDFGGETAVPLLAEYPNLAIVRTFSKSYCFAGARLGFVVANPPLIQALFTTKNSFNHFPVDALTQKIGIASCRDSRYYAEINGRIIKTRDSFSASLRKAGWDVLPSLANFVFARKAGLSGRGAYEAIKREGILVRYFDIPGITDFVRISIGLPADMEKLLAVMSSL